MKYSKHLDYVIASIIYLGTQPHWWARTPPALASELSLNVEVLRRVLAGFPGVFRKSPRPSPNGEHYYSLQARYGLREGYMNSEEATSVQPLDTDRIRLVIDIALRASEMERHGHGEVIRGSIAVGAAALSSITALLVTYLTLFYGGTE